MNNNFHQKGLTITLNQDNRFKKYITQRDNTNYIEGIENNKLYYLPALDLTINHESGLSSYKRVLNYEVGKSGTSTNWSLTIKDKTNDNPIKSISNNESEFKKYFPYDLGKANKYGITDVDASLPIYSSPWWN